MKKITFNPIEDYKNSVNLVRETRRLLIYEDEFYDNFEGFKEITPLFRFSNENISDYYSIFDFNNKDVLTVIGSCDQALSAIYSGAKKVDVFDINKISYYLLILKKYAIESLSYNEFLTLFDPSTKLCDIDEIYKKIDIKDKTSKEFWDLIFSNSYYFYFLFLDTNTSIEKVKKTIPYLKNENEYNKLKGKLKECNFNYIGGDLEDIINNIDSKYDYINLSNIIDYLTDTDSIKKIYTRFFNSILKPNGMCMLEYEWYLYTYEDKYIECLFPNHRIEKYTMEKEEIKPSSSYIYTKK